MFNGALWESKCHGNNKIVLALPFVFLVLIIALPFSIHFFGLGPVFWIIVALAVVALALVLVVGRKMKWHNPKLVFALTENGLYFTQINQTNSYFYCEYENIAGYSFTPEDNDLTTVVVYFKTPSNAGIYGNLKSLKMVKIEQFETLVSVLKSHEIEAIDQSDKR